MNKFDERKKSFEKKFVKDQNISDEDIRKKMDEYNEKAKSDFI